MTILPSPIPADFSLSREFIDLWIVSTALRPETMVALEGMLSAEEALRIGRVRIQEKRREALVSRGVLRFLLGAALHEDPRALRIGVGPHGKPFLEAAPAQMDVTFNVSHTAGRVMVGMTLGHAIGVDIETVDDRRSHEELATRFFTRSEAAAVVGSAGMERARAFFTCWCRKEAVLKATGMGIAAGLQTFAVPVCEMPEAMEIVRVDGGDARRWLLHDVPVEAPYVASIAVEACNAVIRRWSFPTGL